MPDASSNLRPTADELDAGAIPGFKLDTGKGGSAVGQYTTLAYNFLLGNYNVNSNLETDDGSSRYLMYRNYFVYSTAATDFAMNAHYNYYVDNVGYVFCSDQIADFYRVRLCTGSCIRRKHLAGLGSGQVVCL